MFDRLVVALVAATLFSACSAPPEKERHQAEGALAAARAAGAAEYATEALTSAETALAQYDAAVASRDYRQALRVALEARDGAYEAARTAGDQKALARGRAERLVSQLEVLVAQLRVQLSAVPASRAQSAPVAEQRAAYDDAMSRLQEARSNLDAQDFQAVSDALEPRIEPLRRLAGVPDDSPGPR